MVASKICAASISTWKDSEYAADAYYTYNICNISCSVALLGAKRIQ